MLIKESIYYCKPNLPKKDKYKTKVEDFAKLSPRRRQTLIACNMQAREPYHQKHN